VAKGPEAFRTISEAADELGVPQHVLRFWESKFSFIRPMKRAGGRRFYRPQDIAVLAGVQRLLHQEGYTIKGVQRLHKEEGMSRILSATSGAPRAEPATRARSGKASPRPAVQGALAQALADLESAKKRLDGLLE
jgi:DNA-binding transcriptional MerR regulator